MANDLTQGLFYPEKQAASAALASGAGAPDPSAAAALAARARPTSRLFSRRLAIRWAGWGSLLLLVAGWGNGFLTFFRPGKTSPFGGVISAGTVDQLKVGDVKAVTEGKFYVTRVPEGFIALWWKCPHLGCTVPWRENDPVMPGDEGFAQKGRFNCPCHGSIYNRYGQILQGPAPRPMDRFPLAIEGGKLKVDTGKVIARSRAGPEGAVPAQSSR